MMESTGQKVGSEKEHDELMGKLLQAGQLAKVRHYKTLIRKMAEGTISASELKQYYVLEAELGSDKAGEGDSTEGRELFASLEDVAKFYGKSIRTIYRWQSQGMPALPDGRFDREEIETWRRSKKGMVQERAQSDEPDPLQANEAGLTQEDSGKDWWDKENKKYQARMRELEYRKRTGELIERKRVLDEFVARVHAVKQSLLALERSLPPDLVACRSEREMSAIIHKTVRTILETFSRPLPPDLTPPDGDIAGDPDVSGEPAAPSEIAVQDPDREARARTGENNGPSGAGPIDNPDGDGSS